jgi:hypothetical protein
MRIRPSTRTRARRPLGLHQLALSRQRHGGMRVHRMGDTAPRS